MTGSEISNRKPGLGNARTATLAGGGLVGVRAVAGCNRGTIMTNEIQPNSLDQATLEQLNEEYVRAFMSADVNWYEEHLADDFVVIESDGSVLNKAEFLTNTAKGPDVIDYKLQKVDVRIYGGVALVQATGLWTKEDKSRGVSRYIDVYVRTGTEWKAVSAQITRAAQPME